MDQFTRRIIGFGIHQEIVDGPSLCLMFQRAIQGKSLPKYLSTDNDPLYRFHQWQANLRVLEVVEIKTVPYVPLSHPFVERLVGTLRREYLDRTLFWTTADLEAKLRELQEYFNEHWTHSGLEGRLPDSNRPASPIRLASYGLAEALSRVVTRRRLPRDFMNSPRTRCGRRAPQTRLGNDAERLTADADFRIERAAPDAAP